MTIFLSILAICAIGGLVYMVFVKNNSIQTNSSNGVNTSNSPQNNSILEKIYQGLLNLNIEARDNALDEEVLLKLESVIDKVIAVAEPINDPVNYSELTVSVNRMHSKYIPSILNPYISLSDEDRISQKDTFINKLSDIENELDKVKEFLDSGNIAEFEKMSRFINAMFEKNKQDEL